jgi:hypothetical protein
MLTLIGELASGKGLLRHVDLAGDSEYHHMPPSSYLRHQPPVIPLLHEHDDWHLGQVHYLERSARALVAVAQASDDIEDLLRDGSWFFSDGVRYRGYGIGETTAVRIHEVSIGRHPAAVAARPICFSASNTAPSGMPLPWYSVWGRANEAMAGARWRAAPDHLDIVDIDPLSDIDELMTDPERARKMSAEASAARSSARAAPAPRADTGRLFRHSFGDSHLTLT